MTSESAQALEAQRHSLLQESTAEMMVRDDHIADVLSQIRSELQHYHFHAEGQQTHAELRQYLERSNADGAHLTNLNEETRTANRSIAPEVTRLQAREASLSTIVSTKRNQQDSC